MPTEPRPITLFDVVRRAVEICDPTDSDERLGRLLEQFEDADEPVTAIENLEERLAIAVEGVDVEAAAELRDAELAPVLDAAGHTERPVIVRVIRDA